MSLTSIFKGLLPKGLFGDDKPKDIITAFQSDSPEDLMNDLQKAVETEANSRANYERAWFLNIAFVMGKHYVQWEDSTRRFLETKAPSWRVRLTVNKILPRYRKNLALLDSYEPRAVCTPNSTEVEDVEAATLGTKILQGQKETLHLRMVLHEKSQWQLLTGNGYITLPFWDSGKGQEIPLTQDVPVTDPMTGQVTMTQEPTGETVHTGDIGVEAPSPFELYPLGKCTTIDNCQGIAWVKVTTIGEIIKLYPETGQGVTTEADTSSVGMYMDKINSLVGSGSGIANENKDKDAATYIRVWLRPNVKFPKGRYIAYANGQVLEYGDIPNIELGPEYEIPFLKYDDITIPARFLAQSTIEQMIPLNKALSKNLSQIIEAGNLAGKPKWIATKGSVAKTAITSEPGEVIEWDPMVPGAQEPHQADIKGLPQHVVSLGSTIEKHLADIGATHEASMGEVPAGVKSGKGLQELKQSDNQEKASYFLQESENKKIFYSALLKLIQAKYKEPRMLKIMGEGGAPEVKSFMGADLRGNTDVYIENTDIIPTDRDERQKFIIELYKTGMLGKVDDDETRKRALRMMQFGMMDEAWEEGSMDAKYARNENKEMSRGIPQVVNFFDHHESHILIVLRAIKNPGFKDQPPEIQALFIDHLKTHQNKLVPPTPPAGLVPGVGAPTAGAVI